MILCGIIFAVLAGCRQDEPLPKFFPVPAPALVADSGRQFDLRSLSRQVVIYDFIFTSCGATCPLMTKRMKELTTRFERDAPIRFVSISVDPARDTPQVLRAYAEATGRDPRWIFLTGEPREIVDASVNGFKLAAAQPGIGAEALLHSEKFVLADGNGWIRGYYDTKSKDEIEKLTLDARALVRELMD